jgi:hypothetical protein
MREAERALTALRESVLGLAEAIAALARDQVGAVAEEAVRAVATTVRDQSYQVVVCGEFKRGKSSLLNAIVGQEGLFPVGSELTTATVMTLRWGPRPRVVAQTVTAAGTVREEIDPADIDKYVTAADDAQAWRVGQLDVELPHERLASGVILVDTPGLGGVDDVHSAITMAFLPSADAVVLLLPAHQPATVSELDFAKRLTAEQPAVIFTLAMADQSLDIQERVEATRARLSSYLDVPPEALNILPVSAEEAWHARRTGDDRRLAASGLPALENQIWTTLVDQAAVRRLNAAVGTMTRLAQDATAPIASELAAMAGPEELAAVLDELDENERAALAVGEELGDQGGLEREFAAGVSEIEEAFRERMDGVLLRLREGLADGVEPMSVEAVTALATTAADAATKAFAALHATATATAGEWERRTAQPLRVLDLVPRDELALPRPPQYVRPPVEITPAVADGTRGSTAGGVSLSAFGGFLGALVPGLGAAVGLAVGGLVGHVVGFFSGFIGNVRRTNAKARARLMRSYADEVVTYLTDYRGDTLLRLEDTQQEILAHLKLQMRKLNKAQLTTIEQARTRVRETARASAEDRAARAVTLRAQQQVISGYAARLRDVEQQLREVEAALRRQP